MTTQKREEIRRQVAEAEALVVKAEKSATQTKVATRRMKRSFKKLAASIDEAASVGHDRR